ncbi:ArsR/SmtB family transcription factor [Alteribacter natronophilus]|uniref:ArsR/SmtB family transcription factor n=1 Tax=Alteribacter natronophilus TaxID=2583810 RepID=UPI00110D3955|nr:metalloregulator ArsR/SmtB family transcription factor [Alteribacter natronophilus]TMW70350.1 winged helix-turn-helix transcriptional regulator [Alteribacter natronophilus]
MAAERKHDVFQAVADPTRREIVQMLANEDMAVTRISSRFAMSRPAISKHLKVLAEAELVSVRKAGREKRYRLEPEALNELREWLAWFDRFWDNKLEKLRHEVEDRPGHIRAVEEE